MHPRPVQIDHSNAGLFCRTLNLWAIQCLFSGSLLVQTDTDVDTVEDANLDYRDTNDDYPTREEDANADCSYAHDDQDGDGTPDYLQPNFPEVKVFNVVTPNHDTVHDCLMISGLDVRPNNGIKMFNRWRVVVYKTNSFNGNNNQFDGTYQARTTYDK